MKRAMSILWPSFLAGGVAEMIFFTLVDPADLQVLGNPVGLGRTAVYTLGFFLFWLFAAASSALTCYLLQTGSETTRD